MRKPVPLARAAVMAAALVAATGLTSSAHADDAPAEPTSVAAGADAPDPSSYDLILTDEDTAGIKAALDRSGQKYTLSAQDEAGEQVTLVKFANPEAGNDVVNDYYWSQYPMSPDEIASINADANKLVDHLTSKGFKATVEKDKHGVEAAVYDVDDPATLAAAMEVIQPEDGTSMSDDPAAADDGSNLDQ